jgi:hypothetical protein
MFKNKQLKQLKDVQASIKKCKENLAALDPPTPDSFEMGHLLYKWIVELFSRNKPHLVDIDTIRLESWDGTTDNYLRKLGEYFINISDYHKDYEKYSMELKQLQQEERRLKEKLGIE